MRKQIIALTRTCITTALVFPAVAFLLFAGCDLNENGGTPAPAVEAKLTYVPDTLPVVSANILVDGSESSSIDGKPLSYTWALTQNPAGSTVTVNNIETSSFDFVPDIAGTYTFRLTVGNDTATDQASCNIHIWHNSTSVSTSSITAGDHTVLTFTRSGDRYDARLTFCNAWENYIHDDTNQYLYFDYTLFDRDGRMMSDCYWWSSDDSMESHSNATKITRLDRQSEYNVGSYTPEELRNCCYLDSMIQYRDQYSNFRTVYETSLSDDTIQIVVE